MTQNFSLPKCPNCQHTTHFIPASLVTITDLEHIEYFYKSPHFSYLIVDGEDGEYQHVAAHFTQCNTVIPEGLALPPGYDPQSWQVKPDTTCPDPCDTMGTLVCKSCMHFEKHILGEEHRLS